MVFKMAESNTKKGLAIAIIALAVATCILAAALAVVIAVYPRGDVYSHPELEAKVVANNGIQTSSKGTTWKTVFGSVTREDMEYGELRYTVFLPSDYDESKEYPILLYLHGGSIGYLRTPGATPWSRDLKTYADVIAENIKDCIIFAPQAPGRPAELKMQGNSYWSGLPSGKVATTVTDASESSPYLRAAEQLLESYIKNGISYGDNAYRIDRSRVYLAGHSMGAIGAYTALRDCPNVFAAAIVGAGIGDPETVDKWKNTYAHIIHGRYDNTIHYTATEEMQKALTENSKVEIIPLDREHSIKPYMYTKEQFAWMAEKDFDDVTAPYNAAIIALSVTTSVAGAFLAVLLIKRKKNTVNTAEISADA